MNVRLLLMTVIGGLAAAAVAEVWFPDRFSIALLHRDPLPHQIPKYEGGVSLRFAMVHDVIHERFPKHGAEYYRQRSRVAREQLERSSGATQPTTRRVEEAALQLMDDIAVGHVHLGEFDAAIAMMRDKLARQQAAKIGGVGLYSTYANLGTAMMIDALVKMQGGADAAEELRDSLTWVRKSIEVNPQAHFGREVWQVVLGEYLLDARRNPKLLLKYDMIGNNLVAPELVRRYNNAGGSRSGAAVREALETRPLDEQTRLNLRSRIETVGAESDWARDTHTSSVKPVPFDEPTLGIIGMWRYGGGANPHFSLALAETMLRVGQLHIAWCAYERTARLSSDTKIVEHCRARQAAVEEVMAAEDRAELRPAFEADLKAGLEYQAAYQKYEADKLAAGASVDDPTFYDEFFAKHGDIASDPGHADEVSYRPHDMLTDHLGPAVFGGGLSGLMMALVQRRGRRRRAGAGVV